MNLNITKEQYSSRFLCEIKSCGTVAIEGLYFSDFNVKQLGDEISGFFAKLDLNYFVEARLYVSGILHATISRNDFTIFGEYHELPFFESGYTWVLPKYSSSTIRIIYNKDCLQHIKLYLMGRFDAPTKRSYTGSVTIPENNSVTKSELVLNTTNGIAHSSVVEDWFGSPDKRTMTWYPTCQKSDRYTFPIPHLGTLIKIDVYNISGKKVSPYWSVYTNSLFITRQTELNDCKLETERFPYAGLTIKVESDEKVYLKLEYEHDPDMDKSIPASDQFGEKVITYKDGAIEIN